MTQTHVLPARSDVPVEQTWDLESIFATPAEWDAAREQLSARLPELAAYQGRLGEGPQTLAAFLDLYQKTGTLMGKIATYASNGASTDTNDQAEIGRASCRERV